MKYVFVFLALSQLFVFCQSNSGNEPLKLHILSGSAQGTTYNIRYVGVNLPNYQQQVDSILSKLDNSLSTYVNNSTISEFNRQANFTTKDEHFIRMLFESQSIQQISNGAFDPAVMPLVKAWGFGPDGPEVKENKNIDSLLQMVNWNFSISMTTEDLGDRGTRNVLQIVKKNPVEFDFNAIAQGYTVDVLFDFLKQKGVKNLMVELGGEVRAVGVNDQMVEWKIGVDKPVNSEKRALKAIIEVDNKAVATSGNYRKFYEKEGKRYAHTINPKTGYPVQHNLLSASVMAETCAQADAFATVFMVLGLEESIQFIDQHPELGLEAYFIDSDSVGALKSYFTPGILNYITEVDTITTY